MGIYTNRYMHLSFLEASSSKNQPVLSLRAWSVCFLSPPLSAVCLLALKKMTECVDAFHGGAGLMLLVFKAA